MWTEQPADAFESSPSVRLMATPGHTTQDITTLVRTVSGLAVCTHLWWSREGPAEDPLAVDQEQLERSRGKLIALEPALIVPGHAHLSHCPSFEQRFADRTATRPSWSLNVLVPASADARSADRRGRRLPGQGADAIHIWLICVR